MAAPGKVDPTAAPLDILAARIHGARVRVVAVAVVETTTVDGTDGAYGGITRGQDGTAFGVCTRLGAVASERRLATRSLLTTVGLERDAVLVVGAAIGDGVMHTVSPRILTRLTLGLGTQQLVGAAIKGTRVAVVAPKVGLSDWH